MKKLFTTAVLSGALLMAGNVMASTSASWNTPTQGDYCVGTQVTLTGNAGGVGGTGMDLVLVLDSSGSMASYGGQAAQRDAANALVNSLTPAGTSVGVVDFDSYANTVRTLVGLTSDIASVHNAINGIDAYGGTNIGGGVAKGAAELTGVNHTTGRQQIMVVMSDGGSSAPAAEAAAVSAMAAGVDAIHSVAMGTRANEATLLGMVDGADDIYGNTDDYGIFSASSMADLTTLLTGGGLVGIASVSITDALSNAVAFTMTGLGDITITDYTMLLGANVFNMHAVGTDGSFADAQWTLNGVVCNTNPEVPEPTTMLLMGTGLAGLVFSRRRKTVKKN